MKTKMAILWVIIYSAAILQTPFSGPRDHEFRADPEFGGELRNLIWPRPDDICAQYDGTKYSPVEPVC